MANRFFTSQPLGAGPVTLDGDDAHHLSTVRRFANGDEVTLFNGDGSEYAAIVESAGKKSVTLNVIERRTIDRESWRNVTIAAALPKGDRFDFLLEKLVELGCTTFVPLITERSVVEPKEAKREKWERAVIEASKQCGRNRLMAITAPTRFESWLSSVDGGRFLFNTAEHPPFPRDQSIEPITIAIGPEGGWTDRELTLASQAGWQLASLGSRILRIETAAIAATTLTVSS